VTEVIERGEAASMVFDRIAPDEKVSRPSRTPRDASSMMRIDRFDPISATTRRMALAPISRTPTRSGGDPGA
jgi:hypothetical protein